MAVPLSSTEVASRELPACFWEETSRRNGFGKWTKEALTRSPMALILLRVSVAVT